MNLLNIVLEKPEFNVYGTLLFIGAVIAILFFVLLFYIREYNEMKRIKKYLFCVLSLLALTILFVVGAFLFDNFFHYLNGEEFGSSGISFLGGAITVLLVYLIILLFKPNNKFINFTIMLIPLVHIFGRLGCFFVGCCYGIPVETGICYWEESKAALMYGYMTPVFPTQILEAIVCLIIFLTLLLFLKKNRYFWYCVIYGVYRFFAEFLRGDNRGSTLTIFSPSQLMSIVLLVYAIIYYFFVYKKNSNYEIVE